MPHIPIERLTDHLLGEATEESSRQIGAHLDSGCRRCNALFDALAEVRRVGIADAAQRLPEDVERTIKALSGFARPPRQRQRVDMRPSFDSLAGSGLTGIRSLQSSSRHLVYYSQGFALDLRMDYERSVRDVVVVGQLLSRDWGPLPDVPAYLISGNQVVSHSTTGRLGEFHMEGRPHGPMNLRLAVDDDEIIDVALDRRQPGEPRPVLVERDELAEPPAMLLSRASDRDPDNDAR